MSTSSVEPRKRGSRLKGLTAAQKMWCEHMAADPRFNLVEAARKAGYKAPSQSAQKLMKNKAVMAYLGKVLQERINRCRIEADAVLGHLARALFLDPYDLFERAEDGSLIVRDLGDIPPEVRRCITKIEAVAYEDEDGNRETKIKIDLMSKDAAMANALKHLGLVKPDGNGVNINVAGRLIDFDKLCEPPRNNDVIEGRIEGRK